MDAQEGKERPDKEEACSEGAVDLLRWERERQLP
jgi:hypothetical protein